MLFLVESILREVELLSSRFFIPAIYAIHFQMIGMSVSVKFTNQVFRVSTLHPCFKIPDFASAGGSLCVLQQLFSQLLQDQRT